MTYYEYAGEMQEMCFKISQAYKVLGDTGLYDFYYAASTGFDDIRKTMSVEDAEKPADKDELAILESTAAYYKDVQEQAAKQLDQEVTA